MKLLLLDRDGTLNVDRGRAPQPLTIALLPGVAEGLLRFRDAGYRLFVITNQSAVGDRIDTQENLDACNARLQELLGMHGIVVERIYACIHPPDAGCDCRKPGIGMWHQLLRDVPEAKGAHRIMAGDKDADVGFAKGSGCLSARVLGAYPRTLRADLTVRSIDELADCLLPDARTHKVMTLTEAAALAERSRAEGKTVVTTNGSFDLLHAGHRFLFDASKKAGDVLIVGVNSDASVRRYKGEERPLQAAKYRALQAAKFADAVFVFEEDDPRQWLPVIRPHVHVNSAQYGSDCIEADTLKQIGATLKLVEVDPSLGSTTSLLASISPAT